MRGEKRHRAKDDARYEKMEGVVYLLIYGVMGASLVGLVITIFIDHIRTQPIERGWLQNIGIIGFVIGLALTGYAWDKLKKK